VRFPAGVLFPALVALLWFHSSRKRDFHRGFVIFGRGLWLWLWLWVSALVALHVVAFQRSTTLPWIGPLATTRVLRVSDTPAGRFLPHPDADWYDQVIGSTGGSIEAFWLATRHERQSYMRFILDGHGGNRCSEFRFLAEWEPLTLTLWADHVVDFDDDALEQLMGVEWPNYWHASLGASDAAVDRLAARIAADPPTGWYGRNSYDMKYAWLHLLIGADTPHALTKLAELGREHELIDVVCHHHGLWIPPTGPAIRRYSQQPQIIARKHPEPVAGLRVGPPAEEILADPRGLGCALPLTVALDVDLTLLESLLKGSHPFIVSFCADCEADEEILGYRGWLRTDKVVFDEERDEVCPGYDEGPRELPPALGLRPSHRYRGRIGGEEVGKLGGRPDWRQYPDWPSCCDKPMFFVGQIDGHAFGGHGGAYGFGCECGKGVQITQIT
jgi:hypothetical protein